MAAACARKLCQLLLLISPAFGLFEDQVGKFDWKQSYVGKPVHMFWDQSSSGKKLIVSTEKNVLASIHANNGSIVWRRVFEDDKRGHMDTVLHQGTSLVTVSGGGKMVRGWHPSTGSLSWESVLKAEPDMRASGVFTGRSKAESVVVATAHGLYALRASDGAKDWELDLPNSDTVDYWHMASRDHDIILVGVTPKTEVTIVTVGQGGKLKSHRAVRSLWITVETSCAISGEAYFVCYRPETQSLQILPLTAGQAFTPQSLQDLNLQASIFTQLQSSPVNPSADDPRAEVILRVSKDHMAVLTVSKTGVKVVKDLPKVSSAQITYQGDRDFLLTLERSGLELSLTAYDMKSWGEVADLAQTMAFTNTHGHPNMLNGLLFNRKKDSRMSCKVAFTSEDYTIHFRSGKTTWRREESLAYILSVEMVDLPLSENQAKFEDEFGSIEDDIAAMFVKRLLAQLSQIQSFAEGLISKLQGHRHHSSMVAHDNEDLENEEDDMEEELTRDEFNLKKIIIAVTASGKIFGLRSHTGKLVWQQFLPELSPFDRYSKQRLVLYTQRTTAHFPLLPQCVVVGKSRKTGNGFLYAFDPVTGSPVEGLPTHGLDLGYDVIQAALLSEMSEDFVRGLVLLGSDFRARFYPENVKSVAKERLSSMFMYLSEIDTGYMNGYRLVARSNGEFEADPVWNIDLQKKQQRVVSVISKRVNEHVHSQGRVLGDRSVLYKYLNPNLVAVVTEGEEPAVLSATHKGPSSFFNIYLIDGVTGHIVFHVNHKRAKGPVNIVHAENWVVYSYFNERHRRPEMSVMEMFEGKEQSNSTAFSSFNPPPQPLVLRQSYIFPLSISTMATTVTEKGITSKNLIISLRNGGLLSIPKALLDPRRPIIPSQETMEEGTIPYIPEIQVFTEATLNYNQSVVNIRGIHTTPAGLESTSLVLAYGLDLFYTRVNPSKMFDVLKEDFDYLFIGTVLLIMIAVSVISQKLASRKALNRAWK
ncbi:ER membrane protein complex subunit 1-like [Haliotis cracherodii]|uniref:ER membrane protein complex subunit 1-like n=1 Tax=Haliotis cracherodii TaxID=6455 RepID=UPI0039EC2474